MQHGPSGQQKPSGQHDALLLDVDFTALAQHSPSGQQSPFGQHGGWVLMQHGPSGQHGPFGQQGAFATAAVFASNARLESAKPNAAPTSAKPTNRTAEIEYVVRM
jgi:hypothetical protein